MPPLLNVTYSRKDVVFAYVIILINNAIEEVLQAKAIINTPAGETVFDFGQNHAGVMEFDADFG